MGYYEFFTRALKPGVHYVEVDPNNLCDDLVSKVREVPASLAVQMRPASFVVLHMHVGRPAVYQHAACIISDIVNMLGSWCCTMQQMCLDM